MIKSTFVGAVISLFFLFVSASDATTITIVNADGSGEGFNSISPVSAVAGNPARTLGQQYLNVFRSAAKFWEGKIRSDVEIRVRAAFNPLLCTATSAQLGGAGPLNGSFNFPNAPQRDTLYVIAQANSLAGQDLDPSRDDVDSVFNSSLNGNANCLGGIRWWLGIGAEAPSGTISLFDTVLHELGHGLGFLTFVDQQGRRPVATLQSGSLVLNDPYMLNLFDVRLNRSWGAMSDSQRRTSSVSGSALVWRGSNVGARAGVITGGRTQGSIRVFAPNPFQPGSSVSHWDTTLSPDELMEPFATEQSNSCATILALKDMGWRTRNECTNGVPPIAPIILLLDDD